MIKLFAFYPNMHGPWSFFVCAESETEARAAVDKFTYDNMSKNAYECGDWPNGYIVEVKDILHVAVNDNT